MNVYGVNGAFDVASQQNVSTSRASKLFTFGGGAGCGWSS